MRTLTNAKIALGKTSKDLEKDIIYVDNLFAPPSLSSLYNPMQSYNVQMTTYRSMMPIWMHPFLIACLIFRAGNFSVGPTKNQKLSARRADRKLGDFMISGKSIILQIPE